MREVLFRVIGLFQRRAIALGWAGVAVVGVALTRLPLLGSPGYELALGLTLLLALAGGPLAIAASRHGEDASANAVLLSLATVPALVVAAVVTRLTTPCDPFASVAFVPVLILPTAMLVGALGRWLARWTRRWWTAGLAWLAVVLLGALPTSWPLIAGPQVFAYNHLGGFLPGPLYDEELALPASLLWFRLATCALALGLTALLSRRTLRAAALLACFLGIELAGTELGFRMSDEALAERLGGVVETDELILHFPRSMTDEEVSRVLGDLRFRYQQISAFFGGRPPGKVRVWWYRSAEEKQRLVGAAHTQFAKPWRREVHVNAMGYPHPVIKHELVHAMAAPWGARPFGVAASLFGLFPHVGVIEGMAVAADDPVDEQGLHQWAASMKKQGLLPDVASLMTPTGFYGAPPSRAYTIAGSFLRYLGEHVGRDALRTLYRDGDFERAFGRPLPALAADYVAFLDTVPLDAGATNQAAGRFRKGSLFERPCAREVERLAAEANALLPTDALAARQRLDRCRALQPQEPSHVLAEVAALRRLEMVDAARALLDRELERLVDSPASWAEAAMRRAELADEEGDEGRALELWRQVLETDPIPPLARTAWLRLQAAAMPEQAAIAARHYFASGDDDVKLLELQRALDAAPDEVPLRYLVARRLALGGAHAQALPLLTSLLREAALHPAVARETARLALDAAVELGHCDEARRLAGTNHHGAAFEARARDQLERCAFLHEGGGTSTAK
ncbi:MAG: hypothetical protein ACOZQL_35215 [Myxococcota bacterium]